MESSITGYHGYIGEHLNAKNINDRGLQVLSVLNNGEDFADLCQGYFSTIGTLVSDGKSQHAFEGVSHFRKGRLLWGQIKNGTFGYAAELKDCRTGSKSYDRTENDVELLKYVYMIYIPEGYCRCLLVLQKNGNIGIKSVLTKAIANRFNEYHKEDGMTLGFLPYLDINLLYEYMTSGEIVSIKFLKDKLPLDIANKIGADDDEESAKAVLTFTKLRKRTIHKLLGEDLFQRLKNKESTAGLARLDIGFDYDTIKLEISKEKQTRKTKVFNLIDSDGFIESREIVPPEGETEHGWPTFTYVCDKAFDYLCELCYNLSIVKPEKPESFSSEK
ncbi:MAG: hypothetical protein RRY12_01470 [Cloacibacillus sp.]